MSLLLQQKWRHIINDNIPHLTSRIPSPNHPYYWGYLISMLNLFSIQLSLPAMYCSWTMTYTNQGGTEVKFAHLTLDTVILELWIYHTYSHCNVGHSHWHGVPCPIALLTAASSSCAVQNLLCVNWYNSAFVMLETTTFIYNLFDNYFDGWIF